MSITFGLDKRVGVAIALVVGVAVTVVALVWPGKDAHVSGTAAADGATIQGGVAAQVNSSSATPHVNNETRRIDATAAVADRFALARAELREAADLRKVFDRQSASSEPGSKVFAVAALTHCFSISGSYGLGAEGWSKFMSELGNAAPDREQRIEAFRRQQSRCQGFASMKMDPAMLLFTVLESDTFRRDPIYALSSAIEQAGSLSIKLTPEQVTELVSQVLQFDQPELVRDLQRGFRTSDWNRLVQPSHVVQDEALWGLAFDRAFASRYPEYVVASTEAARDIHCLSGRGCVAESLEAADRRHLSKTLPPAEVDRLIAEAQRVYPMIVDALASRDGGRFVLRAAVDQTAQAKPR